MTRGEVTPAQVVRELPCLCVSSQHTKRMPTAGETARVLPSRIAPAPQWLDAWGEVEGSYRREVGRSAVVSGCALRREIVFCLLSGHGVTFELALSATDVVMALDPLGPRWDGADLQARLE